MLPYINFISTFISVKMFNLVLFYFNSILESVYDNVGGCLYYWAKYPMPEAVVKTHKQLGSYPESLRWINHWMCWTRFSNFADLLVLKSCEGDFVTQSDVLSRKYQHDLILPNEEMYYKDLDNQIYRNLYFVIFYENWFVFKNGEIYFFPEGVDLFLHKYSTKALGENFSYFTFNRKSTFLYNDPDYLVSLFRFVPSFCENFVLTIFDFYLKNIKIIIFISFLFFMYTGYITLFYRC